MKTMYLSFFITFCFPFFIKRIFRFLSANIIIFFFLKNTLSLLNASFTSFQQISLFSSLEGEHLSTVLSLLTHLLFSFNIYHHFLIWWMLWFPFIDDHEFFHWYLSRRHKHLHTIILSLKSYCSKCLI